MTIARLVALLAMLAIGLPPLAGAQTTRGTTAAHAAAKTRIVVQINEDDGKKWMAMLGNLRNIQAELGKDKVAIAVVAIGPGLDLLMADSIAANEVKDALSAGVEFVACENTMHARKIGKDDLIDGIGYARAGYVEIVRRQQRGWSYLRP
jgi:intracellular sulfur oxidation DsrE/DsrF family protein